MIVTLSKEQLDEVLNVLSYHRDSDGLFNVDIEVNDILTVTVMGRIDIETERDDDYFTGTGYTYIRRTASSVSVTAQLYDEESNVISEGRIDKASEDAIYDFLNESEY